MAKIKQISVFPGIEKKSCFHVDYDLFDDDTREIVYSRLIGQFKTAKEANEYAQKRGKEMKADIFPWEDNISISII